MKPNHPEGLIRTLLRARALCLARHRLGVALCAEVLVVSPLGPAVSGEPGNQDDWYGKTDTPINPGNSSGPLFLGNKVIGVNTVKLGATEIEGIGFAVHHDEVRNFLARSESVQ